MAGALLCGTLLACGGDSTPHGATSSVCPGQTTVGSVIRCAKLFEGAVPLHLPADPSSNKRYGAFRRGGESFVTRAAALKVAPGLAMKIGASPLNGRALGYANTVYLATIARDVVTALKPAVVIDEAAMMQQFFAGRAMEGRIGVRGRRKNTYSESRMLPIRVQLAADASHATIGGQIVNARQAVRAADGRCLAALSASGAQDPLTGPVFTADIALQRRPGMHAAFDDELIARWDSSASDMGADFYPSVASLLGKDPLGTVWQASIHGSPDAGPGLELRFVHGGGSRCS